MMNHKPPGETIHSLRSLRAFDSLWVGESIHVFGESAVIEIDHAFGPAAHVGHDESDARE